MQWPPARPSQSEAETAEQGSSPCPGDETLFSLALGELEGASQTRAEQHVRDCVDCREILSEALRSLGGDSSNEEEDGTQQVLLDRYELLEPIGSGGAGVVYRGYDPALKRDVAVKILRPDLPGSREAFQIRLRSEAQATAQLSHPNVVTAYDVGATDSGGFIVLEYFSGGTLEEWLHGEHPLEERLEVMAKAGRGLAAAHEKGLVHRDFKPQNVLMGDGGRVCVTDFGLARLEETGNLRGFQMESTVADATQTRGLMGTPNYMAPEVFAGARGDERSDQYSFSVALYQAINDRHPFRGGALVKLSELLTRMQSGMVEPWVSDVPDHVRRAVERGLSADPAARFASMEEMLGALEKQPRRGTPVRRIAISMGVILTAASAFLLLRPGTSGQPDGESTPVQAEAKDESEASPAPPEPHQENAPPPAPRAADAGVEKEEATVAAPMPQPTRQPPAQKKPSTPKKVWKPRPRKTNKPAPDQARFDDKLRDPF